MISLDEAKKMIDTLLGDGHYTMGTLARAIGAYPKTIEEIVNLSKKRLPRKQAMALIDVYCRSQSAVAEKV